MDLHELSALEIEAAYRSGETTPTELVDHLLERIAGEEVGAFVTVTADSARARAVAATRRWQSGDGLPRLYGVPSAVKDLTMTAGVRTTFGSAAMRDFVPDVSDVVAELMEAGGLISLGKTSTPEFGAPCYTEPEGLPPARTPWDLTRSAGGSSGGAAAAVASGLVPVAHGSDGGGSIRIPASVCGLVGLKPSRGRVSTGPTYGDISGLSAHGSLATTVRDAAAFLDVIAGHHTGDPTWAAPLPTGQSYLGWCDREPGRLRIATFCEPVVGTAAVDPEVRRAYDEAISLLEGLGHAVEEVPVPLSAELVPVFEVVWSVGTTGIPVEPELEPTLRPLTRWLRDRGRAASAPAYNAALVAMRQAAAKALVQLHPYDAVLTPTLAQLPALVGELRDDDDPAADFEAQKNYTPFTSAWNVTGMPAVSLPTGWSSAGLPIGTMLAGRPGEDHRLLALAAQVEGQGPARPRRAGR
jgi:amidase